MILAANVGTTPTFGVVARTPRSVLFLIRKLRSAVATTALRIRVPVDLNAVEPPRRVRLRLTLRQSRPAVRNRKSHFVSCGFAAGIRQIERRWKIDLTKRYVTCRLKPPALTFRPPATADQPRTLRRSLQARTFCDLASIQPITLKLGTE